MINYWKFKSKIKEINSEKRKIQESYLKDISKARKQKKSPEEINEIRQSEYFDVGMVQEKIDIQITNYLRNKANTLFVPLPDYDDKKMWVECSMISQQKVLTTLGISTIKTAIRKEWKEKAEIYLIWLASLTGIIGALTGLIAVLKR